MAIDKGNQPQSPLSPLSQPRKNVLGDNDVAENMMRLANSVGELVKIQTAFLISFQSLKESLAGKLRVTKAGRIQNVKTGAFASKRELFAEEFIKKLSITTGQKSSAKPTPATPSTTPTPASKESLFTPTRATETPSVTPETAPGEEQKGLFGGIVRAVGSGLASVISRQKPESSTHPSKTPLEAIDINVKKIADIMTKEKANKEKDRDKQAREKKPGFVGKMQKFLGFKSDDKEKKKDEGEGGFFSGLGAMAKGIVKAAAGFGIGILAIAGSLFIAAKAFKEFADVQWEDFLKGVGALAALVGSVILLKRLKADKSMISVAIGLTAMAGAMWVIANALQAFQDVDWSDMGKAGLVLLGLVGGIRLLGDNAKTMVKTAVGLAAIAGSLWALSSAIKTMADVDWELLGKIGVVLAGITVAVYALSGKFKDMMLTSIGLLAIAGSMWAIGESIDKFQNADWKSFLTVGVFIVGLLAAVKGFGAEAAALLGVVALGILGIGKALEWAAPFMHELAPVLIKIADVIQNVLVYALSQLQPMLQSVLDFLGQTFRDALVGVKDVIVTVGTTISGILTTISEGIMNIMTTVTDSIIRLSNISGDNLKNVAVGIGAISLALAGFAAGQGAAGLSALFTKITSFGDDSPIDKIEKLALLGPGLEKSASALEKIKSSLGMTVTEEQAKNQTQQIQSLEKLASTGGGLEKAASALEKIKASLPLSVSDDQAKNQAQQMKALEKLATLTPTAPSGGGFLDMLSRGVQRAKETVGGGAGGNTFSPVTTNVVNSQGPTNNIIQSMPASRTNESSWVRWQHKIYAPS